MPIPLSRTRIRTSSTKFFGGQGNLSSLIGVFRGVVQEVGEHLGETGWVDFQDNRFVGEHDTELMMIRVDRRPAGFEGQLDDVRQDRSFPSEGRPCRA